MFFFRIVTFHNVNSDDDLYNGYTYNILLGKLLVSKYINTIKPKDVSYTKYKNLFLTENKNNGIIFSDELFNGPICY